MGQVGFHISFRSRSLGPFTTGEIHRHASEYSEDVAEALAEEAEDTWLDRLHGSLRHQTPYYTTQIDKRPIGPHRWEVHDSGVLYGAWLESGAYTPRTRFPGYHSMEYTEIAMKHKRGGVARRILREHRSRGRLI